MIASLVAVEAVYTVADKRDMMVDLVLVAWSVPPLNVVECGHTSTTR